MKKSVCSKIKGEEKSLYQKICYFLLEDESIISWIACLLICFAIIKFIFFPFFGMIFSTQYPFVIVESESMEHNYDNFDAWWGDFHSWYDQYGVTKEQFLQFPLKNGFYKGDIIAVAKAHYKVGDVIVFDANQPKPIIHRIMEINYTSNKFSTKGDNNQDQLPAGIESYVSIDKIYGKAFLKIPKLGYIKLFIAEQLRKIGINIK